ncbi:MAG: TauD/TfdA family dioxygenase [Burkholderiaceae bacterium]|nr:TauD/TfdA family dioxygenase [Burkholderiaceae bacterium]
MTLNVAVQPAPCGALVRGVDLRRPLDDSTACEIRHHWLQHLVLAFPDQPMSVDDLERFASSVGPFGPDPYFEAIPGHPHVAQVKREADETSSLFADNFHSDWSFLASPPAATLLYGDIIPPVGGDTLFANQYLAWDALPAAMKSMLADRQGVHSARRGYSRQGRYGENDKGRSMAIRYDDSALATQLHPIARRHPETGRTALFVSPGYTIAIAGMPDDEAQPLLLELFKHQAKAEFVYAHRWSQGTLLMWDNRCLVHAATGGYDGHRRLLHRITVGERPAS